MGDQDRSAEKWGLGIVGAVVLAVVAGVVGIGLSTSSTRKPAPPAAAALQPAADALSQRIEFASGDDQLPERAAEVLSRVSRAARQDDRVTVHIHAFYDPRAAAADRQAVAQRRRDAVRHALEANGVAPRQMHLAAPTAAAGKARTVALDVQP